MRTDDHLTLDQALRLAHRYFSQGQLQPAEDLCQRILQAVPLQPEALNLAHQMGASRLRHYRKTLDQEKRESPLRRETLPNFVIIGAMKCGTTSLYHYLKEHPDIYLPEQKEHGIYLDREALIAKIEGQFDTRVRSRREWADILVSRYDGEKMIGDASTYYTKFPFQGQGVPEIIHILKPEARIIYLLRNPVERIVSHYLHLLDDIGPGKAFSFDSFLSQDLSLPLNTSLYGYQLQRFLTLFGLEQVKVVTLEEFKAAPVETIRQLFQFLGVDPAFQCANLQEIHKVSRSRNDVDSSQLLFPRDVYDGIMPFIAQDVKRLEGLLGRRFDEWDLSREAWTLQCADSESRRRPA